MKAFSLFYRDRYAFVQCNGTHLFQAESLESARAYAREWLIEHGGLEGISWEVREA
jgi:hypothetical protein